MTRTAWFKAVKAVVVTIAVSAAVVAGGVSLACTDAAGVEGVWRMDGYGMVGSIDRDQLVLYQATDISCVPALMAQREGATGADGRVRFPIGGATITVRPGPGPGRATVDVLGSVGTRTLFRISKLPEACGSDLPDTPVTTFEVFWRMFAENYPFFAAKGVDWSAVHDRYRPQVTTSTTEDQLFDVLAAMIEPLRDAHTTVLSPGGRSITGIRPGTVRADEAFSARVERYVNDRDTGGTLRFFANRKIAYSDLPGELGYLRVTEFAGYSDPDGPQSVELDTAELGRTLDTLFTETRTNALRGLIIDVRLNNGGFDTLGLQIASRLTDRAYVAYAKRNRNDPHDPTRFTRPQPIQVQPAAAARYTGPVVVLTSGMTVSAGETFTQALIDRPTRTVRVGQNTQGVFSDVLTVRLPNGWVFGLPNEQYLNKAGRSYDGTGIPPHQYAPVFTADEFARYRDSAFDLARRQLGSA